MYRLDRTNHLTLHDKIDRPQLLEGPGINLWQGESPYQVILDLSDTKTCLISSFWTNFFDIILRNESTLKS